MALKCTKCEAVFPEGEAWTRRTPVKSEFWGVVDTTIETSLACPECRCEELVAVTGCDRCGHAEALEDDDYCAPCALELDLEKRREAEANRRLGIAA